MLKHAFDVVHPLAKVCEVCMLVLIAGTDDNAQHARQMLRDATFPRVFAFLGASPQKRAYKTWHVRGPASDIHPTRRTPGSAHRHK